ncbi:heme ABC transporter ATP-binding protein [Chryseolinea lacunae]|uniref:Heme ABC transporter ATP-binding protein n=1 Tax=Chryseolinea lacunae TaxID=2801331 RepID=A0ABS1L0E4_9BACT|nr:heme ABC transporter ATP-binding protein [Chryseolinea lacunae]MBL0744382.1 heme ABC transporter ATP-binding protein [Chryseolinea lacunae]
MYQATNISYRIGEKQLLHNVNLTVVPGKFTAVAGPNGAGKSTLLKTLAQEHRNYQGEVLVNGKSARVYSPRELSLVRAVLSQNTTISFAFTVQQIVELGRHGHRSTRRENDDIVDEVVALTGLEAFRDRSYLTLSGGEKQRVQLARVLTQVWEETLFPRYILLDEPTSSLDIAQQQLIFALAKKACSRNIGVMAIVHDLNQAVQFADDLYFLRAGKIIASGEAHVVFTKPVIEETFCCRVNIYRDPCNNCPYIIPERETFSEPRSVAINL